MNFKHIVGTWMLALTSTVFTPGANATGEFPTRPVRLISPFPSGSGPDTVMRQVAEKLQHKWGQAVIVEGKPGAAGAIAINELKRGAKDGHDLVLIDGAAVALAPHLYSKLSYDPGKDFDLITPMFKTAFFVLVPATSPYKTLRELVSAAQAHPGKLNYGSWGMGSFGHVGAAMLEMLDVDGRPYIKERIQQAKAKGSFWQSYKYINPATKKIEPKRMYCERLDDSVVCAGIYK